MIHAVAEHAKWQEARDDEWKVGEEAAQASLIASLADDLTRSLLDDLAQSIATIDRARR